MIRLTGLDTRVMFVEPGQVAAIIPALQSAAQGTIGKPVGSCIVLTCGQQVIAKEKPEEVAKLVDDARPLPVFGFKPN